MNNKLYKLIDLEESIIINEQLEEFKKEFTIQYIIENDTISDKDKIECLKNLNESKELFNNIIDQSIVNTIHLNEFLSFDGLKNTINSVVINPAEKTFKWATSQNESSIEKNIKEIINSFSSYENTPQEKKELLNKLAIYIEKLKNLNKSAYDKLNIADIQLKINEIDMKILPSENTINILEELFNRNLKLKDNKEVSMNDFNKYISIYNNINKNFSNFMNIFIKGIPLIIYAKSKYSTELNNNSFDSIIGRLTDILNRYRILIFKSSELYSYLQAQLAVNEAIKQEEKMNTSKMTDTELESQLSRQNNEDSLVTSILKNTFNTINSYAPWNWGSTTWKYVGLSGAIAAVSLGAYYLWKRFYKIKCDGLEGIELTKCEIKATEQAIKEAIRQKEKCYSQLNPTKCREEVEKIIGRWKSRKNMLLDKLETNKSKPFQTEEKQELF
jgi:hypothetical protein